MDKSNAAGRLCPARNAPAPPDGGGARPAGADEGFTMRAGFPALERDFHGRRSMLGRIRNQTSEDDMTTWTRPAPWGAALRLAAPLLGAAMIAAPATAGGHHHNLYAPPLFGPAPEELIYEGMAPIPPLGPRGSRYVGAPVVNRAGVLYNRPLPTPGYATPVISVRY
jgi:hypothetical protein